MDNRVYTNMIYPAVVIIICMLMMTYYVATNKVYDNTSKEEYTDSKYFVEHNYSSGDIEINTIIDKEANKEYIMVVKGKEITVVEKTKVLSEDPQEGINNE